MRAKCIAHVLGFPELMFSNGQYDYQEFCRDLFRGSWTVTVKQTAMQARAMAGKFKIRAARYILV